MIIGLLIIALVIAIPIIFSQIKDPDESDSEIMYHYPTTTHFYDVKMTGRRFLIRTVLKGPNKGDKRVIWIDNN